MQLQVTKMLKKLWNTLQPPRVITFLMIIIYMIMIYVGFQSMYNFPPPINPILIMSAGFIFVGSIMAIIAAWVGGSLKFLEGPGCGTIFFGLLLSVVVRATSIPDLERIPISLPLTIIIGLFFIMRMLRIWNDFDNPAEDEANKYKVKAALMKEQADTINFKNN